MSSPFPLTEQLGAGNPQGFHEGSVAPSSRYGARRKPFILGQFGCLSFFPLMAIYALIVTKKNLVDLFHYIYNYFTTLTISENVNVVRHSK
jgi:hypothetical protein